MKEVVMTEAGMSPERQGWFAGLKEKVRKSFTIQGSKEKFYQNNSELIVKATANLSPEDKQAAYAQIEQDALSSAKLDVAAHWGATVIGVAVAGLGGGLVANVGGMRDKIGGMGKMGEKMANAGKRAHDSLRSMVGKFNFRREGSSMATKGVPTPEQRLRMQVRNQEVYARQAIKDEAAKRIRIPGTGRPIDPDSVTPISDVLGSLRKEAAALRKKLLDQRIQGDARRTLEAQLQGVYERRKNLRAK